MASANWVRNDDAGGSASAVGSGSSKKRKRNRPAVSCTSCKQRKIRCSRQIPCEACLKRGAGADCRWPDNSIVPPTQVFALETVVDAIRDNFEERLKNLEAFAGIQGVVPSSAVAHQARLESYVANANDEYNDSPSQPPSPREENINDGTAAAAASGSRAGGEEAEFIPEFHHHAERDADGDQAESAAVALEELAGGTSAKQSRILITYDTRSTAAFLSDSLVMRDFKSPFESNLRLPILSFLSRPTVVDAFLSAARGRAWTVHLLDEFWTWTTFTFASTLKRRFMEEIGTFWSKVEAGERDFDPACIAQLSAIMATALVDLVERETQLVADDFYSIAKIALEVCNWRTKPSFRSVQAMLFLNLYMSSAGDMDTAHVHMLEAIDAARYLGIHNLGKHPEAMPQDDPALPSGTLYAREICVRLWWDIIGQDWIGSTAYGTYSTPASSFNTSKPRNFDDDQLERGAWNAVPWPDDQFTLASLAIGKYETSNFCRRMADLGPVPTAGPVLDRYYAKLVQLDQDFSKATDMFWGDKPSLSEEWRNDWRLAIGASGVNTRRLRLHRPLMLHGYRDPRFRYSVSVCIQCARAVLFNLSKLAAVHIQRPAFWFLRRHAMSACVALYIDALHDAANGIDPTVTDEKLSGVPVALSIFKAAEEAPIEGVRENGRKARLLIEALQDARSVRARSGKGRVNPGEYAKMLQNIAQSVKNSPASQVTTSNGATPSGPSSSAGSSSAPVWLDDQSMKELLSSLGLLDSGKAWQPTGLEDDFSFIPSSF